ncbi:hypothetical protein EJ03DRAFT_7191 [Teratosphaeria nubilosa]|uniref:Uncharacterized protein n=1 Tax=Teratosphaeria nubilosa TaxID=161662 RepID=A0A6G1LNA5_9PEZI|nr:hypothetical protein EJ03DRAFT_7191 [Teratosphaeria nubilosa]
MAMRQQRSKFATIRPDSVLGGWQRRWCSLRVSMVSPAAESEAFSSIAASNLPLDGSHPMLEKAPTLPSVASISLTIMVSGLLYGRDRSKFLRPVIDGLDTNTLKLPIWLRVLHSPSGLEHPSATTAVTFYHQ